MKESKFQTFCNMGQKRGWCELTTVLSGIFLRGGFIYLFIYSFIHLFIIYLFILSTNTSYQISSSVLINCYTSATDV